MNQQNNKAHNLVNAASSLKNFEFDFGDLSGLARSGASGKGMGAPLAGSGGVGLKQQPRGASSTFSGGTGSFGSTGGYKAPDASSRASGVGGTTGLGANFSSPPQKPWKPDYMSSAQPGAPVGKPDPLANLWSSASSTATVTGTRSTGGTSWAPSGGGSSAQAPSGGGAAGDPFDFFSGGKPSLSSMKSNRSSSGGATGGISSSSSGFGSTPAKHTHSGSTAAAAAFDAFDLSGMKASIPTAAAAPKPKPAGFDPFADFGVSTASTSSNTTSSQPAPSGDPFGGFGDFTGHGTGSVPAAAAAAPPSDDLFGGFAGARPQPSATQSTQSGTASAFANFSDPFGAPSAAAPSAAAPSNGFDAFFGAPPSGVSGTHTPPPSSGSSDPLADMLFASSSGTAQASAAGSQGLKASGGVGADDWGSVFGESGVNVSHDVGGTTELEGLPPPPAGLTAATAAEKGEEFYRAGQFADAIKWLLWAEALVGSGGKEGLLVKVLTTRSGCFKEAGEMKKAVADCTQVLEMDPKNSAVRMQRAQLYEGMEKYKLGVQDLREVLRLDAGNRPAMQMLNRLQKLV